MLEEDKKKKFLMDWLIGKIQNSINTLIFHGSADYSESQINPKLILSILKESQKANKMLKLFQSQQGKVTSLMILRKESNLTIKTEIETFSVLD